MDNLVFVTKAAPGSAEVVIHDLQADSACADGVQVRMATTAIPVAPPGAFPDDPLFADVTFEDLDPGPNFEHLPPAGSVFYLVVEELPGGLPGPSGRYGY